MDSSASSNVRELASDQPVLKVDDRGSVRFAHLSFRGKTSRLRLPLLIWKLEAGTSRQLELMRQYLGALERKFEKEHGFFPRKA